MQRSLGLFVRPSALFLVETGVSAFWLGHKRDVHSSALRRRH